MVQSDNIGQNLNKIRKKQHFKVPDGYFEGLTARLNEKIHAQSKTTHVKIFTLLKPYMAAAVILIIALIAGTYYYKSNKRRKATERFYTEVFQEVERDLHSFSEESLFEVLLNGIPEKSGVSKALDADDMINYLLNEDLAEEELTSEL
jgi:hypothetical protein